MMRSLCSALLLLLSPNPVQAAPLVSGPVTVADDGTVSRAGTKLGRLPLPPPPRSLRQTSVVVAGRTLLHVLVRGKGDRSAELLSAEGAAEPLFAGTTGPQDKDGEWSRHLRVDGAGVLLYQRREGALRCDGSPVFLFPKLYDFAQARFRPVSPVVRAAGLVELRAERQAAGAPAGAPLNSFSLRFASTNLGDDGEALGLGAPREAEDDRLESAWAEGMGGAGIGEFLTAQSHPSPYRLRAIRIVPGDAASRRAFREANRLRSVLLLLGPKLGFRVRFPRDPLKDPGSPSDPYWAILPEPVATTCASVVIEEVYPGALARGGGGRTAISELRFFTELEFAGGIVQLARDLDGKDEPRGKAAVAILSRLGATALPIAGKDLATAPEHALPRRLSVLLSLRLPESAPALAALLPRLTRASRGLAIEGLVALGSAAENPILALLTSKIDEELQAELLRALGLLGGDRVRLALLERAGLGSTLLRSAAVDALGSLGRPEDLAATLEAAVGAGARPRRQADLVHALGRLGRADRAAVTRRLGELWSSTSDFETRYRILASIGRLDPGAGLSTLSRGVSDTDPVLRWFSVEQLRRVPGATADGLLRRALADRHPPVRAGAAIALASRPRGDGVVGRELARLLERERWTFVLAATSEALGSHCVPEGIAALRRAFGSGNPGYDLKALLSFARCAPPTLGAELLALGQDRKRRTPIRVRALAIFTPSLARSQLDPLARLFGELRRGAAQSEAEEAVAVAAARALTVAGGASAADALADALALDPHETIRTAAALGLGRLCSKQSAETLRRASEGDSASSVRRAADGALRRCKLR
jgi:HEAT repeat protein